MAEEKGITGTQLIFSDIGTPKEKWNPEMLDEDYYDRRASFDVYNYVKTELVRNGIPAEEKLKCVHEDVAARDEALKKVKDEEFEVKIGSMTYTERKDAGIAMLKMISGTKTGEMAELGEFRGFKILVSKNFMGADNLILRRNTDYYMELSTSPIGNMVRIENCFNAIQEKIGFLEKKLEDFKREMEQAKAEYEKPFQYEQELKDKIKRQYELNAQLDLDNKNTADGPDRDGTEYEESEKEESEREKPEREKSKQEEPEKREPEIDEVFDTSVPEPEDAKDGNIYAAERAEEYRTGRNSVNEQNNRR